MNAPLQLRATALAAAIAAVLLAAPAQSHAIPQYARNTGLSCIDCHFIGPKLNEMGEGFLARGYRLASASPDEREFTMPLSVWITGRFEDRSPADLSKAYVPKVELVSGGPIGSLPLSYFVEWRVVSLDLRGDGTLRDRGGRFEDALVNWEIADRHSIRAGQFRPLQQYDVSLRLSVSEPALFSASLPGEPSSRPRLTGLRAFSPAGRSPSLAYTFHSVEGRASSDGLFHALTIPFTGELSLPLSSEARREASFELQGPPKGVFLETFYRQGLNSVGAHAFVGDNRWLLTGVGRARYKDWHATAGIGLDDAAGRAARMRCSLELEYLLTRRDSFRPGAGFRVEHITNAGRDPAFIPYFVLAAPNTQFTFLLQVEGHFQGNTRGVFLDLSAIF